MTTSGTVGTTTIDVATLVEHACRRAKLPASAQTIELIDAARESLYMLILHLANRGLQLWCLTSALVNMTSGRREYPLPAGGVDVRDAYEVTLTTVTGTETSAASSLTVDLGAGSEAQLRAAGFSVASAAGAVQLVLEYSDDDVTYAEAAARDPETLSPDVRVWFEADGAGAHRYWRVRDENAVALTTPEAAWATALREVQLNRLNFDDYARLGDAGSSGAPRQYWVDRQTTPIVNLWQVPSAAYDNLPFRLWYKRDFQDVGYLSNEVEVPRRWLEHLTWALGFRISAETPEAPPDGLTLCAQMAEATLPEAQAEERDPSPVTLRPEVSAYRRRR